MNSLAVDSAEAGPVKHGEVVCEKYHKLANLRFLPNPRVPRFIDASWSRFRPRVAIAGRHWFLRGFRAGHRHGMTAPGVTAAGANALGLVPPCHELIERA
jgi:hypothetical protein